MKKGCFVPGLVGILVLFGPAQDRGTAIPAQAASPFRPSDKDIARPVGFPEIGKWMLSPNLSWAHWLGEMAEGKAIREPINIIIVDPFARSADAALRRLVAACKMAGFESHFGHSSGYWGWLGGRLFPQYPTGKDHALSDEPFAFSNNHGRFFGPLAFRGRYYFIGALSREKVVPESREKHEFVSYDQARDRFAQALVRKAGWRIVAFVGLDNALLNDPQVGTCDHDGVAVALSPRPSFSVE